MEKRSYRNILLATVMFLVSMTAFCALSSSSTPSSVRGRRLRNALEITAVGKDPTAPLGLCEGDCDSRADCQEGLMCFQRDSNETVPGCDFPDNGQQFLSMDVCILDPDWDNDNQVDNNSTSNATNTVGNNETSVSMETTSPTSSSTMMNDDNEDIGVDLTDSTASPTEAPSATENTNFDETEEDSLGLNIINMAQPTDTESVPSTMEPTMSPTEEPALALTDVPTLPTDITELLEDLKPTAQPSLGFTGSPSSSSSPEVTTQPTTNDTPEPTIANTAPTPTPQRTFSPTQKGTNSWVQTYGMTDPFEFVGPPPTLPPTPDDLSWLFTPEFMNPRPLERVGNNGDPSSAFPLGPCQGDCDGSSDCAGPLECVRRSGDDEVRGCTGEADPGTDYCVWPSNYVNGMPPSNDWTTGGFALKVYWEPGYDWQNETIERKWCITRDYRGNWDGVCWLGLDAIPCDPNELYVEKCEPGDYRQRFDFVTVSSDEVMVQAYGEDRCVQRDNKRVELAPCDRTLHTQRWFAIRGGFNERRFEWSQKTLMDECVNQDHHPKPGEVIRMFDCEKTRKINHLTSWWELMDGWSADTAVSRGSG